MAVLRPCSEAGRDRLDVWTVPDFTVEKYREELLVLHRRIERDGGSVTSASRFLIEAVKAG